MNTMQGAFFLPCSNRSRTREAPTPTNISTKSEPLIEKNGTLASPATARASSVLPVPGGPINRTPLGMRPPSFWNFCGSFRNSMISCSSSFASSTPATSLNVTFFCELDESFALLLPNDSALLPPLCIWRMKNSQKPIIKSARAHVYKRDAHGLAVGSFESTWTPRSMRRLARPSYCVGAWVLKRFPDLSMPLMSWPVMVTPATVPESTQEMNSLNEAVRSCDWNFVEKFQMRTPTTKSTTQNNRLFNVEFKQSLPNHSGPARLSRA